MSRRLLKIGCDFRPVPVANAVNKRIHLAGSRIDVIRGHRAIRLLETMGSRAERLRNGIDLRGSAGLLLVDER